MPTLTYSPNTYGVSSLLYQSPFQYLQIQKQGLQYHRTVLLRLTVFPIQAAY